MLFHKNTKKFMKVAWMILGILIIISMVMLYTPIFTAPQHGGPSQVAPSQTHTGAPIDTSPVNIEIPENIRPDETPVSSE